MDSLLVALSLGEWTSLNACDLKLSLLADCTRPLAARPLRARAPSDLAWCARVGQIIDTHDKARHTGFLALASM